MMLCLSFVIWVDCIGPVSPSKHTGQSKAMSAGPRGRVNVCVEQTNSGMCIVGPAGLSKFISTISRLFVLPELFQSHCSGAKAPSYVLDPSLDVSFCLHRLQIGCVHTHAHTHAHTHQEKQKNTKKATVIHSD